MARRGMIQSIRYAGDDALERQVWSFAKMPLVHMPGEVFEYSNADDQIGSKLLLALIGAVLQAISGVWLRWTGLKGYNR